MLVRGLLLFLVIFGQFAHDAADPFDFNTGIGPPPIGRIVTRLTNTTFGIVRGGINMFSRASERIIQTFGRVEDRLRQLLEEFRRLILRGIPELSIPVLDPLHINNVDFDISHEVAKAIGTVNDVTVKHISKFTVDKAQFRDIGNGRFKLDLNLTFPFLTINGFYKVNGTVGGSIPIYGDGKFWLHLIDFKLAISAIIRVQLPRIRLTTLNIDVKLGRLENQFENLMNGTKTGEVFNKAISQLAPQTIDALWPDIKKPIEAQIVKYVNNILENASVAGIARRLLNLR